MTKFTIYPTYSDIFKNGQEEILAYLSTEGVAEKYIVFTTSLSALFICWSYKRDACSREKIQDSSQETVKNIPDILKNVLKDVRKDVLKELSERQIVILELICTSPETTLIEMSRKLKVSDKTIQREFTAIRKLGINIERQDGRKEGRWVINKKYQ